MTRNMLNSELVRQREAELRRSAERYSARRPAPRPKAPVARHEAVTIRLAAPDDGRELELGARAPHAIGDQLGFERVDE